MSPAHCLNIDAKNTKIDADIPRSYREEPITINLDEIETEKSETDNNLTDANTYGESLETEPDVESRMTAFLKDQAAYSEWFAGQQDLMVVLKLASGMCCVVHNVPLTKY